MDISQIFTWVTYQGLSVWRRATFDLLLTIYPSISFTEELKTLRERLKDAHRCKIQDYLRKKQFFEDIAVKTLNDMYVEPRIHESGHYKRLETRLDVTSLEHQKDTEQCKPIKVNELLDPHKGMSASKVLITGSAGSGKSMLSLRLLNLWLDGQLPAIEDVFFYSMNELSGMEECSLAELLFLHQSIEKQPSADVADEFMQRMSSNTLVILDGLDAFDCHSLKSQCFDCNEKVKMSRLIGSIISGRTLSPVSLLVTSRTVRADDYKTFDRLAELHGFTEPMVEEYVQKFCQQDEKLRCHIGNYIDNDIHVASLCKWPLFCNLLCRLGKGGLDQGKQEPFPTTLTQLMTKCVHSFVKEQFPQFTGRKWAEGEDVIAQIRDELLNISKLAKDGMGHQPVKDVFTQKDAPVLSKAAAIRCGFLKVSEMSTPASHRGKVARSFHFEHLTMQEFFAAIALISSGEEIEKLLTVNKGQPDMVLTFLAGLVGDTENRSFLESLECHTTITAVWLVSLVVRQAREQRWPNRKATILLLLRLVHESRRLELWAEVKDFVLNDGEELDLSAIPISPVDLQALTFVTQRFDDINAVE